MEIFSSETVKLFDFFKWQIDGCAERVWKKIPVSKQKYKPYFLCFKNDSFTSASLEAAHHSCICTSTHMYIQKFSFAYFRSCSHSIFVLARCKSHPLPSFFKLNQNHTSQWEPLTISNLLLYFTYPYWYGFKYACPTINKANLIL